MGCLWLDGNASPPPPNVELVTFVSFFSLVPSRTWWPSRAPLTFGSRDAHLSLLPRGSWDGSISSEKVHEVLSHIAVGGEDLADARGPLGPRPAWGALHRVGHPLEQPLTLQALRHPNSQLVVIQTSGKAGPESAIAAIHATLGCGPVASAHVHAKGSRFAQGASTGSSYAHGGAVGGVPTERGGAATPAVGAVRGHQAGVPGGPLGPRGTRGANDEATHIRTCEIANQLTPEAVTVFSCVCRQSS